MIILSHAFLAQLWMLTRTCYLLSKFPSLKGMFKKQNIPSSNVCTAASWSFKCILTPKYQEITVASSVENNQACFGNIQKGLCIHRSTSGWTNSTTAWVQVLEDCCILLLECLFGLCNKLSSNMLICFFCVFLTANPCWSQTFPKHTAFLTPFYPFCTSPHSGSVISSKWRI